ncbi:MAG: Lrp/AsnC family transcriptional regulator [Yoonia sp.]|uniref:Lrp/AsnC family transcriptional regulator n=1 Tax=Yoonia sp. TaxID=2212373 RepID=UPI003EFB12FD
MHKNIDQFDLTILTALEQDCAMTNAQLAQIVGLSTSQCSRRRAQLEADGVITGYHARLDPSVMGRSLQAVVRVNLVSHGDGHARKFGDLIARSSEISEAFAVSGDADYVLLVKCENLAAFSEFIHKTLLPFDTVGQVKSEIVLHALK